MELLLHISGILIIRIICEVSRIVDRPTPESFPRVLFITPLAFNKVTGTGITFTNLFRGWPKDRLATVHDDAMVVSIDVCDTYYRLSTDEIQKFGGVLTNSLIDKTSLEADRSVAPSGRLKLFQTVKKWLFGDGLPQWGILTPSLEIWIKDFKPDVIYTILGSNGLMDIVEHVHQKFDVPLVVHIMDDWMSGAFKSGLLGPYQRIRMQRSIRRIIDKSSLRLGICDAMSDAYSRRFRVPFESFQNVVDTEVIASYITDPRVLGKPVKIVYAGSVFAYAQQQSLIDCCKAVIQLENNGTPVQLDIYCPSSHVAGIEEKFVVSPIINVHPPLVDDGIFFSTICSADILLIPVNYDEKSIGFIRYSMPTRIPAYMASGTPILVYGPPDVAQVKYAKDFGWGHVVDELNTLKLQKAIRQLIEDNRLREDLSNKSIILARERHDVKLISPKLIKTLSNLVKDGNQIA